MLGTANGAPFLLIRPSLDSADVNVEDETTHKYIEARTSKHLLVQVNEKHRLIFGRIPIYLSANSESFGPLDILRARN
jgi:hypothetical protein